MTAAATVSLRKAATSLWIRAPFWRFSVLSATLLTLLFILFRPLPRQGDNVPPQSSPAQATYISQSVPHTQVAPPSSAASAPQAADLSLVTPDAAGNEALKKETGLDAAVLGRLYGGTVTVNGYKVPLIGEHWIKLAAVKSTGPKSSGTIYMLAKIANKRLVTAVIITAMRTNPAAIDGGAKLNWNRQKAVYKSPECAAGDATQVQSCWLIHDYFTLDWNQWADRTVKLDAVTRAAAGDMAAKGITFPQDLVALRLLRNETWGVLTALYLFNPETDHITSNEALSFVDSDWSVDNIHRYPDKLAYVEKIKRLGNTLWPLFTAAFQAGK